MMTDRQESKDLIEVLHLNLEWISLGLWSQDSSIYSVFHVSNH